MRWALRFLLGFAFWSFGVASMAAEPADPFLSAPVVALPKPAKPTKPTTPPRQREDDVVGPAAPARSAPVSAVPTPAPAVVTPAPAPQPATETFAGTNGIWQVSATLSNHVLTGQLTCHNYLRDKWVAGPTFRVTVDAAGGFNALANAVNGWDLRRVSGTLPQFRIDSANMNSKLTCPSGAVTLVKQ